MAKNSLNRIVAAAESFRNVKPVFAGNRYLSNCEDKNWEQATSWTRGRQSSSSLRADFLKPKKVSKKK